MRPRSAQQTNKGRPVSAKDRPASATYTYDSNGRRHRVEVERPPSPWVTFQAFNSVYKYTDETNRSSTVAVPTHAGGLHMLVPINQKEFTNEDMHTLRSLTSPKKTATKDRLVNKTAQMLFSDDQIPEWPALRDRYLQRLEELSENVWGRDAGQEGPAQEKKDFIMLLMALRKVTRNIIRYYVQETKAYEQFPEALSTNPSWQRFVDYLYNIPTSLDWLDEEPFRSWSGLHTSLNPLLALNNIASDLSLHVGNNIHIIAQVIFASSQKSTEPEDDEDEATEEEDESMPYCKTLMDLFPVDLRYSAAEDEEFRMFSKILMKFYDDFDRYKASRGNQLTSSGNHRRSSLALLVSKGNSNKIDTRKMLLLREQQVKVHSGHFVQLRQFKKWKRRFRIFRGIKKMIRRRKRRIKRKVMEAFKKNIIKEKRLVNLHERYLEDLLHRVVDGWKDVVIWCKRFRSLHKRCVKEKKRHYLLLWQHYIHTQTVLEVSPQKVRFTEDDLVPIETIACTFNDAANTATDVIEKVEDGISFSTRVISHALNQGIAVIPPLTSGKYHSLTPGTLYSIKNSSTKKDRIVESVNRSYRKEPKRGWEKAAEIARETTVHLSAFLIKLTGVPRVYPRLNYVDKDLNEGNESVANISLAHEV